MKVVPLPPNVLGVDTLASLSPFECRALVNLGYKFRLGYLDVMTPTEVQGQLSAGLPLILLTLANHFDAEHILLRCKALGVPSGANIILDLEAVKGKEPTQVCDEIDACGDRLHAQGLLPCLYFAEGSLLTSQELYQRKVYRYYQGGSENGDRFNNGQDPRPRGSALIQGRPEDTIIDAIPGKPFDIDFHRQDYRGDVFSALVAE